MRGEYFNYTYGGCRGWGSPPLARGIRITLDFFADRRRITPACAGNTMFFDGGHEEEEDHPRLRGEYISRSASCWSLVGSPPLARGILHILEVGIRLARITPACAGNTVFWRYQHMIKKDHPRLRGEYTRVA